jgi:hypothetical protein
LDESILNPIAYTKEPVIRFIKGLNKESYDGFFVKGKELSFRMRYDNYIPLVLETSNKVFYKVLMEYDPPIA